MGRRKKVVEEAKVEEKKAEDIMPTQQMPLVAPVPVEDKTAPNGSAQTLAVPAPDNPAVLAAIHEDAVKWAIECGFGGDFLVNGPERVNYPQHGHGYSVTIKEQEGKQRLGSARFTAEGVRSYWSIDGIVTG